MSSVGENCFQVKLALAIGQLGMMDNLHFYSNGIFKKIHNNKSLRKSYFW